MEGLSSTGPTPSSFLLAQKTIFVEGFKFVIGPASRPGRVMVLMYVCVRVCMSVCSSVSPEAWTVRYLFDTLDLYVPLDTLWIPWTFTYLLDTLDL